MKQKFTEEQLAAIKGYVNKTEQSLDKLARHFGVESLMPADKEKKMHLIASKELSDYYRTGLYEAFAYSRSAKSVGGDFFDFYHSDGRVLELVIGDVAGKGRSAAFLMAELKTSLRMLKKSNPDEKTFISEANKLASSFFAKNKFATILFARFDLEKRQLTYCRAGHSPILYYNSNENHLSFIEDEGTALGVLRDDRYDDHIRIYKCSFNPGDLFVFYTDGIIEARAGKGHELYGYDRMRDCVNANLERSPEEIKDALIADMADYTGSPDNQDDETIIVLKMKKDDQ